jgi:mono/diheme cytochrome c family protein
MCRLAGWIIGCLLAGSSLGASEPLKIDARRLPPAAPEAIDFARDIEPIFAKNCLACHGAAKQRGGVRLDDGAAALKGGNSGAFLVPGKPLESRLLILVAGLNAELVMPPKEKTSLTTAEIGRLRAWIEQGAKWPRQTSGAGLGAKSDHWAFQPLRRAAPPLVKHEAWLRNDIDRFVLARLEQEKLAPSGEADRYTQIRRLSLDLLGLPPTPSEVDDFVNDTRPHAYERLVERLLASPHYGERWGRHWLDLARYADSDGYEADRPRPYQWRYRDWVIEALNSDMPFDQFTIEQLAGDLLPGATPAQKTATGFHRNTLTNREGGADKEQFRVEAVVDRVGTTAKVWLGLTLSCAQCHDHKYDPLSQREFYQFFAFFNGDNEVDVTAPLPGDEQAQAAFAKKKAELEKKVADYKKDQLPALLAKWEQNLKPEERTKAPETVAKVLGVSAEKRDAAQQQVLLNHYAKSDAKLLDLTKAVSDYVKKAPTPAYIPTLAVGSDRKTHVLIRGDFLRPGVPVDPGVPSVLPPLGTKGKATRLELARWLVALDNPLTARVISNWVWHHYFGRGLVATLEDFGTQGEKPSHPELLDHLAGEFMRQDWSVKGLHRAIVTSATYRQSSKIRPDLIRRDPTNLLLARQNRIRFEAEILRDNALAASGLLIRKVGGPSVKPPQPAGISELTYAGSARWVESKGEDRYRRGLYTWFQRTSPYPMLTMFDAPDGNLSCVRRERSNTPLQALTLLNDATFVEVAQALARRILAEKTGSLSERLDHGFRLCLGRPPSALEAENLQKLYDELLTLCQANPKEAARLAGSSAAAGLPAEAAAWVVIARMLLNLDEFVTRE